MIERKHLETIADKLSIFPAVGILGPRQIGKTTLALEIAKERPSVYLDLEDYTDVAKLSDPKAYFQMYSDKLIILDEIQRIPELFLTLRGVIDANRRAGRKNAQFLILGSASVELLRQSTESLAGRISYLELGPIAPTEVSDPLILDKLWLRGGFPDSLLAKDDRASVDWRMSFIKTYLERDIPQFDMRIPSETLRRLWIMLAHSQGGLFNASKLATSLNLSSHTVSRYTDLMNDLFLVRKIAPWSANIGKRLVKSPKVYVRDSGILHALLGIKTFEELLVHPVFGMSWEGYVIDHLISFLPMGSECYFYRTARGAEIDLIIISPDGSKNAIEIKHSADSTPARGFYEACQDIDPDFKYMVYNGDEEFPMKNGVTAIGLKALMQKISAE